jgi:hypothetical protein
VRAGLWLSFNLFKYCFIRLLELSCLAQLVVDYDSQIIDQLVQLLHFLEEVSADVNLIDVELFVEEIFSGR